MQNCVALHFKAKKHTIDKREEIESCMCAVVFMYSMCVHVFFSFHLLLITMQLKTEKSAGIIKLRFCLSPFKSKGDFFFLSFSSVVLKCLLALTILTN